MLSSLKPAILLALFLLACAAATAPVATFPAQSPGELSFIGNAGSDNVFTVERWKFTEIANLDDPEKIRVRAELDMTSIQTGWSELLESLKKKKDYFHVRKYATATVLIEGAEGLPDGSYRTAAQLTLKGVTQPVELDFTLSKAEGTYRVEAAGELNRRRFKFTGGGPRDIVPVTVSAELVLAEE